MLRMIKRASSFQENKEHPFSCIQCWSSPVDVDIHLLLMVRSLFFRFLFILRHTNC
jgi:hypothetical protein